METNVKKIPHVEFWKIINGWLWYFDLQPGQNCHSKVMNLKDMTHSNGSYEKKSRGRKLADEMGRGKKNSNGALIDCFLILFL